MLLSAVLLCVAALPVAGVVGAEVRDRSLAEARSQAIDRKLVTATLVGDPVPATPMPGKTSTTAEVVWVGSNSRELRATVPVPLTALRGSDVTVWTTTDGDLSDPPLTSSQAGARAGIAAITVLLAAMTMVWVALLGVRCGLGRSRGRAWEAAWRRYDLGYEA
ncbi:MULTISPECIES: hypothetical protein [Nocardioides]|uniref:Uncharacterized protein n=1 Tax=Nocardioides vastitatis TaxID=2568655 RepID=A0ABW0ZMM9_9ACTN|nr:hypothetical protein [Nocardioides sp.]THJ06206.1 hypothetical protein E7Z54_06205 [Nocardioides sp.]